LGCPTPDATHFEVTNNGATGAGSLDQAFTDASTAGGGFICIDQGVATINLGGVIVNYTPAAGSLSVEGNGTTVQNSTTIINTLTTSGTVTLRDLTLSALTSGGSVVHTAGQVTLDHVTVIGGEDGVLTNNPGGQVNLVDSTIRGTNTNGVETNEEDIFLVRSTISGTRDRALDTNTGGQGGGANVRLVNSTLSGNSTNVAGGFSAIEGINVTLVYSTVVQTGASGGSFNINASGTLASFGSVVALHSTAANCTIGGATTSSYSYSDDTSCGFTGIGDRQATTNNPLLGALGANGGPTQTRLPQAGSPLIDFIPLAACQSAPLATGITSDQRSLGRPSGGACDIGAVEVQSVAIVAQPRLTG